MADLILDKYDNQLYPRKLWVISEYDKDYINTLFKVSESYDSDINEIGESDNDCLACVWAVTEISSGLHGILVILNSIEHIKPWHIAHEAVHVSDYYYEELGMVAQEFTDGNEPYAYLVSWATQCIHETLQRTYDTTQRIL